MTYRTLIVLSIVFVVAPSRISYADLIAAESFDYPVGELDGQSGGTGLADAWTVFSTFTFEVIEPDRPLQYDMPGGGRINGGNRALRFGNDEADLVLENEVEAISRPLQTTLSDDRFYFSFLYRYDEGGFIDDNDFVVWWFNDSSGPQTGLKGNGGDGSTTDDLVGRVNGQFAPPQQVFVEGVDISEDEETLGTDFFVVVRVSKSDLSDEPDDYDSLEMWVNPSFDEADAPHAIAEASFDNLLFAELDTLGMRAFSQEPGDAMYWDALRIGTTWEDVVAPLGTLTGDFNGDGTLNAIDIDDLTTQSAGGLNPPSYDLTGDARVDSQDIAMWVTDLYHSWVGDANLDLEFNSSDLVVVLASGTYEADLNATWSTGDFDGDGRSNSSDLVAALADGGYEQGPRAARGVVPEPDSLWLIIGALSSGWVMRRGCSRR